MWLARTRTVTSDVSRLSRVPASATHSKLPRPFSMKIAWSIRAS